VGVDQSDEIVIPPDKSQLSLHVEATTNVVRDAGLKVSDVDGSFTAASSAPRWSGAGSTLAPFRRRSSRPWASLMWRNLPVSGTGPPREPLPQCTLAAAFPSPASWLGWATC